MASKRWKTGTQVAGRGLGLLQTVAVLVVGDAQQHIPFFYQIALLHGQFAHHAGDPGQDLGLLFGFQAGGGVVIAGNGSGVGKGHGHRDGGLGPGASARSLSGSLPALPLARGGILGTPATGDQQGAGEQQDQQQGQGRAVGESREAAPERT
jgi:hypothetical protein